jgi:hypothetical protein
VEKICIVRRTVHVQFGDDKRLRKAVNQVWRQLEVVTAAGAELLFDCFRHRHMLVSRIAGQHALQPACATFGKSRHEKKWICISVVILLKSLPGTMRVTEITRIRPELPNTFREERQQI